MRTTVLKIKADLENCTDVSPLDHEQYAHDYGVTLQCTRCKFDHPKPVLVNRFDSYKVGFQHRQPFRDVNFHINCKDCHNSIFIIVTRTDKSLTVEDNGNFVPIIEFHCHGCIVTGFILEDQFQCKSLSGTIVEGVDLRTGDWTEFDDEGNVPMAITNFKHQLELIGHTNSTVTSL